MRCALESVGGGRSETEGPPRCVCVGWRVLVEYMEALNQQKGSLPACLPAELRQRSPLAPRTLQF